MEIIGSEITIKRNSFVTAYYNGSTPVLHVSVTMETAKQTFQMRLFKMYNGDRFVSPPNSLRAKPLHQPDSVEFSAQAIAWCNEHSVDMDPQVLGDIMMTLDAIS